VNRAELAAALDQSGLPRAVYSLAGNWTALSNDGYLLVQTCGVWILQFFERGVTSELGRFDSEAVACDNLYELLTKPRTLNQLRSRKT
jgi:hypothetical protein